MAANRLTEAGYLPRFRVFLGRDEHWFADKSAVDDFLREAEAEKGDELKVAEDAEQSTAGAHEGNGREPEESLQVIDLHEVRDINESLRQLRDYGMHAKDVASAGYKAGEPAYPFKLHHDDTLTPLNSLRDLLPALRKLGEKGLRLTRFKGLGEMDAEELWETSMDPEKRRLLKVTLNDAAAADEMFRVLMGDQVEPRREFIEKHALEVKDLDV
jgi:DNA gyrase subunit B